MSRLKMAAAGAVLMVTACGSAAGAGAAGGATPASTTTGIGPPVHRSLSALSSPAPRGSSPAPAGNVLTVVTNGATVTVSAGQRLTVDLAPAPGADSWDQPRLTGTALRLVSVQGGYPSRSAVQAVYLAVEPGVAVVSTESDLACLHARPPCMVAQRGWRVEVVVRPSS